MLRSVDLSDYMLTNPVTVSATENVFTAIDVIVDKKVSGVCVVDDDNRLLGVLSELDCLRAILSATYNENGDVGNVEDFMTKEVDYCELHADLVDVAADMIKKGHRRRPVVDSGKLVGQITCRKLLSVVSEFTHPAV